MREDLWHTTAEGRQAWRPWEARGSPAAHPTRGALPAEQQKVRKTKKTKAWMRKSEFETRWVTAEKQNDQRKSKMGVAPVAEGAIIEYVKGQRKSKSNIYREEMAG